MTGEGIAQALHTGILAAEATHDIPDAKATLTVRAADAARAYGDPNPVFTGALTGVADDGITASYSSVADIGSGVGSYAIVPALLDPNAKLANYDVESTQCEQTQPAHEDETSEVERPTPATVFPKRQRPHANDVDLVPTLATCETAGVLGSAVAVVAAPAPSARFW